MSETQTKQVTQVLAPSAGSEQSSEYQAESGNLFAAEFNHNILTGEDMQKIEDAIKPYVGARHELPEVTQEITQLFEDFMENKKAKVSRFIIINQLASSDGKQMLLKVASKIENPYFIESLITQLEARKHKLGAKFKSHTPEQAN